MRYVKTKKERNFALVLDIVRRFGPLSRVDIHQFTHLRPSTISAIVRQLLDSGKLIEVGPSDNPRGRKQIRLRVNDEHGFVIGLEFDAEFVTAALMDLRPRIRKIIREESCLTHGAQGLIDQLVSSTRRLMDETGIEAATLLGIGIGDPGVVNRQEGVSVVSSTIDFWKAIPIRQILADEFGIPAILENNTRTKTLAERVLGAGELADDMVYVEYSRGIGAGIVMGGRLLEGHSWSAGEFGHTHVVENGPPCKCGSFGCLEAIAGASALETRISAARQAGGSSLVLALAGGDASKITAWIVLQAAGMGDKACRALVGEAGRYLGLGLANLVNLLNPSLIVLDQNLELAGPELLEQLKRIVKLQAIDYSVRDLTFRYARLGNEAGVLGAGLLVLDWAFEIPLLSPPKFAGGREASVPL